AADENQHPVALGASGGRLPASRNVNGAAASLEAVRDPATPSLQVEECLGALATVRFEYPATGNRGVTGPVLQGQAGRCEQSPTGDRWCAPGSLRTEQSRCAAATDRHGPGFLGCYDDGHRSAAT